MGTDKVALAFAEWLEAHKRCVEAERRLAEAQRVSRQFGGQPPEALAAEIASLKAESDRLLAIANAEVARQKSR